MSPELRMMVADSIQSGPSVAGEQLSEEAKIKKLEEKVLSLSRKMDRLSSDYQALSEWTMEQLVAIEASKNNSQWDDESNTYDSSPHNEVYRSDSANVTDRASRGGYDDHAVKTASTPVRAVGNWQEAQFQSIMAAINLFPQQVEPVKALFDEAMAENVNSLAQLKESGALTGESIQQLRNDVRIDLQNKLSSILTADQMEDFSSLYKRKNRYETVPENAANLPSGNNRSASVQTHGFTASPTGDNSSQQNIGITTK